MFTVGVVADKRKNRLKEPYTADNGVKYVTVGSFFNSKKADYIISCKPFLSVKGGFNGEKLYKRLLLEGVKKISKYDNLSVCIMAEKITDEAENMIKDLVDYFRYVTVATKDFQKGERISGEIEETKGAYVTVSDMEMSEDTGVYLNGNGFFLNRYKIIFDLYGKNSLNIPENCVNNMKIELGSIPEYFENSLAIGECLEDYYGKNIPFRIKELLFFKNKVNLFDIL